MSKYIVRMNQAKLSYESLSPEILSSKKTFSNKRYHDGQVIDNKHC